MLQLAFKPPPVNVLSRVGKKEKYHVFELTPDRVQWSSGGLLWKWWWIFQLNKRKFLNVLQTIQELIAERLTFLEKY